ncbi:MAG: YhcH/YjgK/YiaL family protein [bacterium]|nr:YhcH/YjgK/YiaL family protein [bacterium]MDI1334602.1 YhcH/YjgK/YiaL family protein [Lacunisphaera sp.]
MAVFGSLSAVRGQLAHDPRFAAAFDYVAQALDAAAAVRRRIGGVAPGTTDRHELAGGAFALEQAYLSKPRAEAFLESHRKFIDVQVVVAGEEIQEVVDIARLTVDAPYNPERDLIKYLDCKDTSRLSAREGLVAVFFPVDGHISRASAAPVLVRKTVVKVPVG